MLDFETKDSQLFMKRFQSELFLNIVAQNPHIGILKKPLDNVQEGGFARPGLTF